MKQKNHGIALVSLTFVLVLLSAPRPAAACQEEFDHNHGAWDALLKQHVQNGSVSYTGLRAGGREALNGYIGQLEGVCRTHFDGWSKQQQLAFWINTYNAHTVKLVVDNFPISSIMKIGAREGAAFDQRFVDFRQLEGRQLSLNDIENKIIRPRYREPRIHFALNCAAKSCPSLRSEAYTGAKLHRQLEAQTRAFITNSKLNRYDAGARILRLSRIFEWYGEDFRRGEETVTTFVGRYLADDVATAIASSSTSVEYLDYDWALNGR